MDQQIPHAILSIYFYFKIVACMGRKVSTGLPSHLHVKLQEHFSEYIDTNIGEVSGSSSVFCFRFRQYIISLYASDYDSDCDSVGVEDHPYGSLIPHHVHTSQMDFARHLVSCIVNFDSSIGLNF